MAGDDNDVLVGGADDDRIVGDRGNDSSAAAPATTHWSGATGTATTRWTARTGSIASRSTLDDADDVFNRHGRERQGPQFDRTNAPFTLDIGSSEVLELNTHGGDDTLTVAAGRGRPARRQRRRRLRRRQLRAAPRPTSSSAAWRQRARPAARARRGRRAGRQRPPEDPRRRADLGRGGAGTDSAQADAIDALDGIENADVPAPPAPPVPPAIDSKGTALRVVNKTITSKIKRGIYTARVRVECPAAEFGGCKGTLSLLTAKTVRIGGVRVQALLGAKNTTLKAGQRKTVAIKLPRGVGRFANRNRTLSSCARRASAGTRRATSRPAPRS